MPPRLVLTLHSQIIDQVRVLVGTAVRDAAATRHSPHAASQGSPHDWMDEDETLLRLCDSNTERTATAKVPAPADGLCFAGAGYAGGKEYS